MSDLRVLSVASEAFPLIKTGGLADVVGALPGALAPLGIEVQTLLPGYPSVMDHVVVATIALRWPDFFGGSATLVSAEAAGFKLLVLDAPHLFRRPGGPYQDADGKDQPDNAERFAALASAAAQVGDGLLDGYRPDIVHAHDWQAALVPVYLRFAPARSASRPPPATVLTVHNLAFQGQFPASLLEKLQLPVEAFTMNGVEYYGQTGFLKGGLALADRITTVSPTYAEEIQGSEMGMGLDGLLRHRSDALTGILNGIDPDVWNPATDTRLIAPYDVTRLDDRVFNKKAVRRRFGLNDDESVPLVGVVSRLTWQKGMDLLAELPDLLAQGGQLALLGAGDAALQAGFATAAARHPGRVGAVIGYDEDLSHLLQGGADVILVPSRFEPCGLTQLYGLRYGCVPVVARVGGLADTVIDANDAAIAAGVATGFQFTPMTAGALRAALARAVRTSVWRSLQERGMATDVSWRRPARRYAELYKALARRN